MRRRQFIGATSATGFAGLAGCLGSDVLDNTDQGTNTTDSEGNRTNESQDDEQTAAGTPGAVLEEYYRHLVDCETADQQFFHSDLVEREFELLGIETEVLEENTDVDTFLSRVPTQNNEATIREIAETGETAIAESQLSVMDRGEENQVTNVFALATEDGEWKLVGQAQHPDSESDQNTGEAAPQVSFDFDFDGESQVTITHNGGDTVTASNLVIVGEGIASGYQGPVSQIEGSGFSEDDQISAGDSVTIEVTTDAHVIQVVWDGESSSSVIGQYQGPGN